MKYTVTFTTYVDDTDFPEGMGPAYAIENARLAVNNYGSSGYPSVFVNVEYCKKIKEGWYLGSNPDRLTREKQISNSDL